MILVCVYLWFESVVAIPDESNLLALPRKFGGKTAGLVRSSSVQYTNHQATLFTPNRIVPAILALSHLSLQLLYS